MSQSLRNVVARTLIDERVTDCNIQGFRRALEIAELVVAEVECYHALFLPDREVWK